MARNKGKGQRFDYLFRRFDRISAIIDLHTGDLTLDEAFKQLSDLKKEVEAKEVYSDYEQHDKDNLLQQINWYFRFYEREI